jgi:hypothetical protein
VEGAKWGNALLKIAVETRNTEFWFPFREFVVLNGKKLIGIPIWKRKKKLEDCPRNHIRKSVLGTRPFYSKPKGIN